MSHVLLTNDFPPKQGGIQAYLWDLWSRLDPSSYAVVTASSHPDHARFDAECAERGITIERLRDRVLLPTPTVINACRSALDRSGARLVVIDPVLPLGLLGPHLGVPYAVVLHGAEVTVPGHLPATRRLLARVLRGAALVVSAGEYAVAEACRAVGGPLANVVQIPPSVDCTRFMPLDPSRRAPERRRLGLGTDGPLVASVSRLVPRKGMDVLVEAATRLAPTVPGLQVAIGGAGREERRLRRRIAELDAPVRMLGPLSEEDKAILLGVADVFVMACRDRWAGLEQEGFGIVFLEAAAAGTPQVAGRSGGSADAVMDGVSGIVVDRPGDPGELALALRRLLLDQGLRHRLGAAARQRVVQSFAATTLAPRLGAALAEVGG